MAFVPFPSGTVEIITNFELGGIPGLITMGAHKLSGSAVYIDGVNLAAALHASYATTMYDQVTAEVVFTSIVVNDLTSASGWQAVQLVNVTGSRTGDPQPNQVSLCVTFQTAKRGRSYRGRNYIPGLPASALQDFHTWFSTETDQWDTNYGGIISDIETAGWTPSVLSRVQDHITLAEGVWTPITTPRANTRIATQRRRLR